MATYATLIYLLDITFATPYIFHSCLLLGFQSYAEILPSVKTMMMMRFAREVERFRYDAALKCLRGDYGALYCRRDSCYA